MTLIGDTGTGSIASLISDPDFTQTIQVMSSTRTMANEGEASLAYDSPRSIPSVVQAPDEADTRQLAQLPEGQRSGGTLIVVNTLEELKIDRGDSGGPDIVTYKGHNYKVVFSEDWSDYGFWKAIAARVAQ